jgi:cytochrome c5
VERTVIVRGALVAIAAVLIGIAPRLRAQAPLAHQPTAPASPQLASDRSTTARLDRWTKVSVDLPVSAALFPPGDGAAVANSGCRICHSADMVLMQPRRTAQQWTETITKMRSVYGAPLPADEVSALALYLSRMEVTP